MSAPRNGREHRYELGERGGTTISVRLIELNGADVRRMRRRQLEAIVWLLRRAAGEPPQRGETGPGGSA